jgi:glycosyltransferase involved in cell wall biosynthesis
MSMQTRISCIICAYNEASRIGHVLSVVADHPSIGEVIVVDDGSLDATASVARSFQRVRVVCHGRNRGKSHAIATGIRHARFDLIMLLDADLIGVTKEDIARLAAPVVTGCAEASFSLRANCLAVHKLVKLDFTSGERVFHKALLADYLETIEAMPSFGFEVFMNRLLVAQRRRIEVVAWNGVVHVRKSDKRGFYEGVSAEIAMVRQILKVQSPIEVILQNYFLLVLTLSPEDPRKRLYDQLARSMTRT